MSAQAIVVSGTLEFGVLVAGVVHKDFVLRAPTLNDSYRAIEAVPLPVIDPDLTAREAAAQPSGVAYQSAINDAEILCQLIKLGTLDPVPGPAALMSELDPDDMVTLRIKAAEVKKSLSKSRSALSHSDEGNSSSSAPATT